MSSNYNRNYSDYLGTKTACLRGPYGQNGQIGPTGPTGTFHFDGSTGSVLFYDGVGITGSSNFTFDPNGYSGAGDLHIAGKLTVDGPIDPIYLELKNLPIRPDNIEGSTILWTDYNGQLNLMDECGCNVVLGIAVKTNNTQQNVIAIGQNIGYSGKDVDFLTIGKNDAKPALGSGSIVIGSNITATQKNTIAFNAGDTDLTGATGNAFYVSPIRGTTSSGSMLTYNSITKEISYNPNISTNSSNQIVSSTIGSITGASVTAGLNVNNISFGGASGPTVSCLTGSKALVTVTAQYVCNTAGDNGYMYVGVSGLYTGANSLGGLVFNGRNNNDVEMSSSTIMITNLTPGINTFTTYYKSVNSGGSVGNCTFSNRYMMVQPF